MYVCMGVYYTHKHTLNFEMGAVLFFLTFKAFGTQKSMLISSLHKQIILMRPHNNTLFVVGQCTCVLL